MEIKLTDMQSDDKSGISLVKILGQPIKDIVGRICTESGAPVFKMSYVICEDMTKLSCEGEQDFPYLDICYSTTDFSMKITELYRQGCENA